jgi:hypothetical protein
MDDLGNILYIVITLVAVIIGLLGRKRKQEGKGTGSGEGSSSGSFMENLEKAFNVGQEEQMVVELEEDEADIPVGEPEYESVIPVETEPRSPTLIDEYERYLERTSAEGSDILLSEEDVGTEPLEVIHLDDDPGTDYFEVVKDFNAATAVVYSAIINRIDY